MIALLLAITILAGFAGPASAEPIPDVVSKVENSVASIVVSRSDWYKRYHLVGDKDEPGKLGRVTENDIKAVARLVPQFTEFDKKQQQATLSRKLHLGDPLHVPESFGSGLVVDRQNLVLTNYHVVQDAVKVYVRLPSGKGSYADILAGDPRSDLAVLKLLDDIGPLTPVVFGDADKAKRGQTVVALANPYAAAAHDGTPSVSTGVVSNLNRRIPGRQPQTESAANPLYQHGLLLQTDARLALGSSGGGLFNTDGECIGITTSLAALAGADAPGGFALPVTPTIRRIIDVLKRGEEVDYGFLGIGVEPLPALQGGAVVSSAPQGSPALAQAALQSGDVIVGIGPHKVRDSSDLMLALGLCLAGDRVAIQIQRGGFGKEVEVKVTLVKYNVVGKTIKTSLGQRPYVGGMRVDYTSILVQRTMQRIPEGVLITDVQPSSKAARLKLFPGDRVTHVGGDAVSTPAAFYNRLEREPGPVELRINRDDAVLRVTW